jgi:acyl-CoA thioesterase-1
VTYGSFKAVCNVTFALIFGVMLLIAGAARSEDLTLVALGDSLTAGYGLPAEDGLVPQLQAWLRAQGAEVTVVNAGVSGDTTTGALARTDWTLTPEVDAVLLIIGGNDLLRGIDPAASRAAIDGILQKTAALSLPVLLVPMQALPNYGPDYVAAFNAIYPELSAQYGTRLTADFFDPLRQQGGAMARFFQADGLHPNALGVKTIVEGMGPRVLELLSEVNR